MHPRKSPAGYGALDQDRSQPRQPKHGLRVPPSAEIGTVSATHISEGGNWRHIPITPPPAVPRRAWSWSWRALVAVAATATALSAAVGVVQYASYPERPLAEPVSPSLGNKKALNRSGGATMKKVHEASTTTPTAPAGASEARGKVGERARTSGEDGSDAAEKTSEQQLQQLQERAAGSKFQQHVAAPEEETSAKKDSSLMVRDKQEQHADSTAAVTAGAARAAGAAAAAPIEPIEGIVGELAFTAMNAYNRRGDTIGVGYPWLEGKHLVEPYRPTTLAVVSPVEGMSYLWNVVEADNVAKSLVGEVKGESIELSFEAAPQYTVVLLEMKAEGTVSRTLTTNVFCKYVRREIRSLFDDERDEMFDTMKILWDVELEEGQAKYGEAYVDVWTIDKFHQVGASDIECDHLHDGIGFGITHSMVTMMFEASMQAVNPMISLPYWDFTMESAIIDTEHDGDYTKMREITDLWTSEWFGSVDDADFQVKDGRWGNMSVPKVDPDQANLLGADVFGRMRSPWNVNDREYLTRGCGEMCGIPSTTFYEWPTCQTHYELQELLTSYYGYTWHSQYGPHGPVHVWIGGNIDCKKDMQIVESIIGPEYMSLIIGYSFIYRKGLFRDGLFKCEGRAEEGTTAEEVMQQGMCGCLDLDMEKEEDWKAIYDLFSANWDFGELTDSQKQTLAFQYCNGVIGIGESSQSSSPLDPTFWSLHPTMERLLQFKINTGTMTDFSWPDEVGLFTGDDGTVYDVVISTESDTCNGHRGSDVFPYGIIEDLMAPHFTLFDKTGPNTYSNRDLVHLFDPSVNALNYIYDNFEWPHCAAQGYDMNNLYADEATRESAKERSRDLDFGLFPQGERRGQLYGERSLRELSKKLKKEK